MRLEDCTKEELILLIHRRCGYDVDFFAADMQYLRRERVLKRQREIDDAGERALDRYLALLRQCEGKGFSNIPVEVLVEMEHFKEEWERCFEQSARFSKEFDRALRRKKENENG